MEPASRWLNSIICNRFLPLLTLNNPVILRTKNLNCRFSLVMWRVLLNDVFSCFLLIFLFRTCEYREGSVWKLMQTNSKTPCTYFDVIFFFPYEEARKCLPCEAEFPFSFCLMRHERKPMLAIIQPFDHHGHHCESQKAVNTSIWFCMSIVQPPIRWELQKSSQINALN